MLITRIRLNNFRSYEELVFEPTKGLNVIVGPNAAGKTNILESIFYAALGRSHRTSRDGELINRKYHGAYLGIELESEAGRRTIEIKLRDNEHKAIKVDGRKLNRMGELMGVLNTVMFSPEDLSIVKSSPQERRRFMDMELCQLDKLYVHNLLNYNKALLQRNKLLKDISFQPSLEDTLDVWDEQLVNYGCERISIRRNFINNLNDIIFNIHRKLSGDKEELVLGYEPSVKEDEFKKELDISRERDIRQKLTGCGPHRDDMSFNIGGMDIRKYGSQGQQRTCALSLKLSEIELVKKITGDNPVLLLDDVLSELDGNRQNYLLDSIDSVQTIVTCTGLDEFINYRFQFDKVFRVSEGHIYYEN